MRRFIRWFNAGEGNGSSLLYPLTRAGIANLYFESIHPFDDGNGRIGRLLAEKSLAQGLEQPTLIALSATLLTHRKSYSEALEAANQTNESRNGLPGLPGLPWKHSSAPWSKQSLLSAKNTC